MKTENLFILLAIASMMTLASCTKDEAPSPLTKEEATTLLTSVNGDYSASMTAFEASTGNQVLNAVDNLGLEFISSMKRSPIITESLQNNIDKHYSSAFLKKGGDSFLDFDFNKYVGTYHKVDGKWVKTSDQTNKIVVIFSYNGIVDNGTLTYFNYAVKNYSIGGQSIPYMSSLSCTVDIVGSSNPVASWTYTANMSGSLTARKMSMNLVRTLGVFSLTHSFAIETNTSGGSISAYEEIKKGDEVIKATSFSMRLAGSQLSEYSLVVDAKFRIKDIVIKWSINLDNNTDFNGNPGIFQAISVWTVSGAKLADVTFRQVDTNWIPYFVFTDGSEVLVTQYLSGSLYEEIGSFGETITHFDSGK